MRAQTPRKAPDGGWGWVVVVACFLALSLSYGPSQAVGVLYPEWLAAFQGGKGQTAWVGSLVSGIGLCASPLLSACVMNFGARPVTVFSGVMVSGGLMLSAFAPSVQFLVFSYGIVVGLGCGIVYAATVIMTCQYFDKRRGLALGIMTTGSNVGGFLYASVQVELIKLYGLEWCLLLVGALSLNLIACAGPMRPLHTPTYYIRQKIALRRAQEQRPCLPESLVAPDNPSDAAENGEKSSKSCNEELISSYSLMKVVKEMWQAYTAYVRDVTRFLQDRAFISLCTGLFLFSLGSSPPVLLMEDVAQSEGLTKGVSIVPLVSIVTISTGMGKLVLGALADVRRVNVAHLYALTLVGTGAALLVVPACSSYLGLQALSAALGFFSGNWAITPYITSKIVGAEALSHAYGVLMFFGGLGAMLGAPVIGWFYDWMQSYDIAFYFSGSCVLLGGLCSCLHCWAVTERQEPDPESTVHGGKAASLV